MPEAPLPPPFGGRLQDHRFLYLLWEESYGEVGGGHSRL